MTLYDTIPNDTDRTYGSSRPVIILGWLLLFQAIGLVLISAVNFSRLNIEWELIPQDFYVDLPAGLRGWAFASLAILALITAVRFLRLRHTAWVHAMLLQGLSLLLAIGLYLQERPFYVYLIMLNCIFMVLYLNYSDVQVAFRSEEVKKNWGGINER
jgi:hypothetical protein